MVLLGLFIAPAYGQQQSIPLPDKKPMSGKKALSALSQKFGPDHFQWIVEMRAFNGIPQPGEWSVVVYDPGSVTLLTEYWVGEGRSANEGPYDEIYPDKAPLGYIDFLKLKLDSTAAFTVAEGEARRARVGFNSLNFVLRSREYSNEPVWVLALIDADKRLVGKVHVSGLTGSVLRTIWINRQGPIAKIIDTAVPNGNTPSGIDSGTGTGTGTQQLKPKGPLYPSSSTKPKQGSVIIGERRVLGADQ